MRKIAGPGHVGNEFVNYNPPGTPTGTYIMAAWANDVQRELIGVQDELSIAEADGSNKYILAAMKGLAIAHGKPLGELFFLHKHKDPAAFDKDNPETYFPALCLDDGDHDIAVANWPDLVPDLRTVKATYNEGIAGEDSQFDVTGWAIVSNVATLTFANTTAELAILAAISEDNLVHESYSSWRSITLASAIGDISAGEYAITNVDPTARTVSFAFTAGDNSGSGTWTVEFYKHRIPGSTTTARVFERPGGVLVAANDVDGECIAGYRRRDRGQGDWHEQYYQAGVVVSGSAAGFRMNSATEPTQNSPSFTQKPIRESITDTVNGTPRTGKTIDPRAIVGHLYIWGKKYVA